MSRSFKNRPFMSICGNNSAKRDKTLAHRGERRAHRRAIEQAVHFADFEDFLPPHRLECSCNEVWCWNRDGHQFYHGLSARDWSSYIKANYDPQSWVYGDINFISWPPVWYLDMMRK